MSSEKRPLPHPDEPIDVWDMVNKYGTYEIQDTVDTDNVFPTIGYKGSTEACVDMANKEIKKKPEQ